MTLVSVQHFTLHTSTPEKIRSYVKYELVPGQEDLEPGDPKTYYVSVFAEEPDEGEDEVDDIYG